MSGGRARLRSLLLVALCACAAWTVTRNVMRMRDADARASGTDARAEREGALATVFKERVAHLAENQRIQAGMHIDPPPVPYDHETSRPLVQCVELTGQQFVRSSMIADYDGRLEQLPAYDARLGDYRLKALFTSSDNSVAELMPMTSAMAGGPLVDPVDLLRQLVGARLDQVLGPQRGAPIFHGFVLESPRDTIIAFRGTKSAIEWIEDAAIFQVPYVAANGETIGRVHGGFLEAYRALQGPTPLEIARGLDPSKPIYITGHSLGAAVGSIAAMDIALAYPALAPQIRLYTYASPKVGDPEFVRRHSALVPNSYRVVNLADLVPATPPTRMQSSFVHLGEKWSFLAQLGDVIPNHLSTTYLDAVERGREQRGDDGLSNFRPAFEP